jgi:hypothetical protein
MKCAIEVGPGAMIYMLSFVKTVSGIQKLLGRGGGCNTQTHSKVISEAYFYIFESTCREMVEEQVNLYKKALRNICPP